MRAIYTMIAGQRVIWTARPPCILENMAWLADICKKSHGASSRGRRKNPAMAFCVRYILRTASNKGEKDTWYK